MRSFAADRAFASVNTTATVLAATVATVAAATAAAAVLAPPQSMHGQGATIIDSQQPVDVSVPACAHAPALAPVPVPALSTATATSAAIAGALIAIFNSLHKSLPPINAWLVDVVVGAIVTVATTDVLPPN